MPGTTPQGEPQPRWGASLATLDRLWGRAEVHVAMWTLVLEIATVGLWLLLKGFSTPVSFSAGLVFHAVVTATALGVVGHLATRRRGRVLHAAVVTAATVGGLLLGPCWGTTGVGAASNGMNWIENASVFTLVGGLRGVVTRLTLLLAFVGASIATGRGKHISIDLAGRHVPKRAEIPVAVVGSLVAAAVCWLAMFGLADNLAVTKFRAEAQRACAGGQICDTPISERWEAVGRGVADDLFLVGRQLSLDCRTLPHVLRGHRYDRYMTAADWNEWVDGADWAARFPKEAVDAIRMTEKGAWKIPAVTAPGTGEARGLAVRDIDLVVFPLGLLLIGLRFVLRSLLLVSRRARPPERETELPNDLVPAGEKEHP